MKKKRNIKHLAIVTIVIPLMAIFSWLVAKDTERSMRDDLQSQTVLGANSINIDLVKRLTGTASDLKSSDYLELKRQFASMMKADPDLHFIYLMGVKPNGKVFFYVDDKPDGTKECSAPGSSYDEAPKEFNRVYETGKPTVEGPSADSWGNYTSGCAPVTDPLTGKPVAIFAMDFNANNWYWLIASRAALPVGLLLAFLGGLISLLISIQRGKLLKESEAKYHVMFEDSPDAYIIMKDSKIIDCNHATELSLGCEREDILGKTPYRFFPEFQDDGNLSSKTGTLKKEQALHSGKNTFEWILQRNDETKFWAIVSLSKMSINNEPVLFATWTDISEKKKVEQELIRAVDSANAANKAKSEFLANMSHEIRTPLNGVIGFTDLLKNTPLSAVQEQYVNNANTSGMTLLGIINDILDFSKIEAGMMNLEIRKTDLLELTGECIDLIKFAATKKNLEVLLDVDPKLPRFAEVDPIRLKQILSNLLGNAIKFTERGEVELKVRYEKINKTNGRIKFSVRDTGIGINPEQRDKLFKAFSQADSSTTRKFGGTGLGLIISEMIAKKMSSTIELESKPTVGTTFFFDIIAKTENAEKANKMDLEHIRRCLVIDDNNHNTMILEHMLSGWGITCVSCASGHAAIEIIQVAEPFDVIICDYHMPELDGLETIKRIKIEINSTEKKQPIILLHSSSDNADMYTKCDELGIRFRLTKPVKSDELYNFLCSLSQPIQLNQTQEKSSTTIQKFHFSSPVTILIAEDNEFNMLLIKAVISKTFPTVKIVEAKNGQEAYMFWVIEQPDLILMDMQMPEMSGVEATVKIRKQETEDQHTPIVALTAGALKEEKEKCMEAGMDEFLTKPLEPLRLIEIVQTLIKKN